MHGGRLTAYDRWVVLSCLGAALVTAAAVGLFYPLTFDGGGPGVAWYAAFVVGYLPSVAALVAAVVTRVPFVALGIGVLAALLVSLLGVAEFTVRGGLDLGPLQVGSLLLSSLIGALPLLVVDLLALRGPSTPVSGAAAGALVTLLRAAYPVITIGLASGLEDLRTLGVTFLVLEVVVPLVILVVAGWLAGTVAVRRRSTAQPGWVPGTPEA